MPKRTRQPSTSLYKQTHTHTYLVLGQRLNLRSTLKHNEVLKSSYFKFKNIFSVLFSYTINSYLILSTYFSNDMCWCIIFCVGSFCSSMSRILLLFLLKCCFVLFCNMNKHTNTLRFTYFFLHFFQVEWYCYH